MTAFDIRNIGLFKPSPPKIVAPAKPSSIPPTAEEVADVTLLLASFLNMEESAARVERHPRVSSQLQLEIRSLRKQIKAINERFQAEGGPELNKAIDTLNNRGNLANKLNYLLCNCPEDIAAKAADAATKVVRDWANPPTIKRKAKRTV